MPETTPSANRLGAIPFVLSGLIAALATSASLGGLAIEDLYRDNTWVRAAWRGNDLVTLLVAVPLLVGSLGPARRGSERAQLVWLGMLAYMLYGYAFYLFGARFNRFFLIYAALLACSLLALVFALPSLDVARIRSRFRQRTPVRLVAGYMLLTALGLAGAWSAQSLSFAFSGTLPQAIVASEHPTGIVFALDLTLLVPGFTLGGIWLWKREPWGYVLGAIMNVKGTTYTLALAVSSLASDLVGVAGAAAEIPLWLAFTCAGALSTGLLLGNMTAATESGPRGPHEG